MPTAVSSAQALGREVQHQISNKTVQLEMQQLIVSHSTIYACQLAAIQKGDDA